MLIINKIETGDKAQSYTHMNPSGGIMTTSSTSYLAVKVDFIIWDYEAEKSIKYGEITVKTDRKYYNDDGLWPTAYRNIAKEIVYRTPFERKSGVKIKYSE